MLLLGSLRTAKLSLFRNYGTILFGSLFRMSTGVNPNNISCLLAYIGIVRWSPVFPVSSEAFFRALDRSKDVGAPVTQLSDHYGVVSMVSGSGVDQGLWPMICQVDSGHQLQYCWSLKLLCLCHVTLCYCDNGMILYYFIVMLTISVNMLC